MKKHFLILILSTATYIGSPVLAMDEPPPDTFIITKKAADLMNLHGASPVVSCRPTGRVQAALVPSLLAPDALCTA